jgi:alkanesulfonate monooxygenase SsuD/methylene tetrahydromethanopterin reductase-like flavin-dependent oxidoreductase (luciferase family)
LRLGPAVLDRLPGPQRFDRLVEVALAAERAGFDCLWLPAAPPGLVASQPSLDPFVLAAALAPRTSTVRLGCLETPITARAPSLLAKLVTSLDVLSGGRAAVGCDAGSATPAAVAEALTILEAMFHCDAPSIAGGHFTVHAAWNEPRLREGAGPRLVARLRAGEDHAGDAGAPDVVARLCDGCAFDAHDPDLGGRLAAVQAAAAGAGRDVALIGVVSWSGATGAGGSGTADGGGGAGVAAAVAAARAAVVAGCGALVADLEDLPTATEVAAVAATLAAALAVDLP